MDGFLNWFFAFITKMIDGLWSMIQGLFNGIVAIFNIPGYISQFNTFKDTFTVIDWIFSILAFVVVYGIWGAIIYLIVLGIRKAISTRHTALGTEDLLQELADMHRDVQRLTQERERIMALKLGQSTVSVADLNKIYQESDEQAIREDNGEIEEKSTNTLEEETNPVRFARLDAVDKSYEYYMAPNYKNDFTLEELCDNFRYFACSKMHLYYDAKIIRLMFAGFASSKLIILQGISGTGKTSLPYAMGKFFKNDATIVSVQPSWRDRSEIFGYFNEFSKKFNETETLKRVYESSYNDDINIVILDEMNIARVEYYFAEMLSIMEMPDATEWKIEIVPSSWENDPKHLDNGNLLIPQNVWYVGTANNDDSTFSISDKVYDRALTINIDTKGVPFDCPEVDPRMVSFSYVDRLYNEAQKEHPLDQKYLDAIANLDDYVIKKFRVAFGNRIMKQLRIFVPVYVACGGTVLEGIDHILATKVFRKFESLNLSLIRDEIRGLINYMNALFGNRTMVSSIEFLERLQKTF
jgi:hypothetical protein